MTVSAIDSAVCGVIVQTVLEPTTGDQRLCSSGKRGKYRHVGDRLLVVALQALDLDRFPRCCDINRSVKRIGGGGISKSLRPVVALIAGRHVAIAFVRWRDRREQLLPTVNRFSPRGPHAAVV